LRRGIIILGPATGAAINPARYLGAFFTQDAFGGTISWAQLPCYVGQPEKVAS
jgi:glycerol uptake facilitator protein